MGERQQEHRDEVEDRIDEVEELVIEELEEDEGASYIYAVRT